VFLGFIFQKEKRKSYFRSLICSSVHPSVTSFFFETIWRRNLKFGIVMNHIDLHIWQKWTLKNSLLKNTIQKKILRRTSYDIQKNFFQFLIHVTYSLKRLVGNIYFFYFCIRYPRRFLLLDVRQKYVLYYYYEVFVR